MNYFYENLPDVAFLFAWNHKKKYLKKKKFYSKRTMDCPCRLIKKFYLLVAQEDFEKPFKKINGNKNYIYPSSSKLNILKFNSVKNFIKQK